MADSADDLLLRHIESYSVGDILDRQKLSDDDAPPPAFRASCLDGKVVKLRTGTQLGFGRYSRSWLVLVRDARESYLEVDPSEVVPVEDHNGNQTRELARERESRIRRAASRSSRSSSMPLPNASSATPKS